MSPHKIHSHVPKKRDSIVFLILVGFVFLVLFLSLLYEVVGEEPLPPRAQDKDVEAALQPFINKQLVNSQVSVSQPSFGGRRDLLVDGKKIGIVRVVVRRDGTPMVTNLSMTKVAVENLPERESVSIILCQLYGGSNGISEPKQIKGENYEEWKFKTKEDNMQVNGWSLQKTGQLLGFYVKKNVW